MGAKKESKKIRSFRRYMLYSVSGEKAERKNRSCPKCGMDSFLANHKDRLTCGKCGYMEKKGR